MCTSRLHRVIESDGEGAVLAADVDGTTHRLLLLAYEGPPPEPGSWVIAHSGYALSAATDEDARLALRELRTATKTRTSDEEEP
jgi:hydrogenase maturation factor